MHEFRDPSFDLSRGILCIFAAFIEIMEIEKLRKALQSADAIIVGAGAGLSTSAGFTYSGERFQQHFSDFIGKYGFTDMYSAGFYPFPSEEEHGLLQP